MWNVFRHYYYKIRTHSSREEYNKWSKNFDERPHRRCWILYGEKLNVTPASREKCSQLQQSWWCSYWFFAAYTTAVTHSAFSGLDNPKNRPSLGASGLHLIRGFLGPIESTLQLAFQTAQPLLQGSRTWSTDRQTHTRPCYSICSNWPHPLLRVRYVLNGIKVQPLALMPMLLYKQHSIQLNEISPLMMQLIWLCCRHGKHSCFSFVTVSHKIHIFCKAIVDRRLHPGAQFVITAFQTLGVNWRFSFLGTYLTDLCYIWSIANKYVVPAYCRAEMYSGHITCCPLVSRSEYAYRTDRLTEDGCQTVTVRFPLDATSVIKFSNSLMSITFTQWITSSLYFQFH